MRVEGEIKKLVCDGCESREMYRSLSAKDACEYELKEEYCIDLIIRMLEIS